MLNGCEREQGAGTWCGVTGIEHNLPVCEQHWQALRTVALYDASGAAGPTERRAGG